MMPKPTTPVITILSSSDLAFGGHVDYTCSVPLDATTQAHLVVTQGGTVVEAAYSSTFADGTITFALGPTPSWTSGGGQGSLEVVRYDSKSGLMVPVKGSAVTFPVAAG